MAGGYLAYGHLGDDAAWAKPGPIPRELAREEQTFSRKSDQKTG
jgi:hypothetical protein